MNLKEQIAEILSLIPYRNHEAVEKKLSELFKLWKSEANVIKSGCPRCGKDLLETTSKQIYCVCGYEK